MTNCPNCGAPRNPHKDKCEYCDTPYEPRPTPIKIPEPDPITPLWPYAISAIVGALGAAATVSLIINHISIF